MEIHGVISNTGNVLLTNILVFQSQPAGSYAYGPVGLYPGGTLTYSGRVEHRPLLGDGPAPSVEDIGRTARLSGAVTLAAGALAVAVRAVR